MSERSASDLEWNDWMDVLYWTKPEYGSVWVACLHVTSGLLMSWSRYQDAEQAAAAWLAAGQPKRFRPEWADER